MSFGFSVGDIISLVQLTTRTYRSWKNACGEYSEITGELGSLAIVLGKVQAEANFPGSLLNPGNADYSQLATITGNCGSVVVQLRDIVEKYEGLGKGHWTNWERLRLGYKNLGDLRSKLTLHTSSLSTYLNLVVVSAIGRVEKRVGELPRMKEAIDALAAEIRAGRREASVMTTYTDDDKDMWRQFRNELIKEGFSSRRIQKFKSPLKDYLKRLNDQGLLEEEEPHGFGDGKLNDAEGAESQDATEPEVIPSSHHDGPIEAEGSKFKTTCASQTAHTMGDSSESETPSVSKSATPWWRLDSEDEEESATPWWRLETPAVSKSATPWWRLDSEDEEESPRDIPRLSDIVDNQTPRSNSVLGHHAPFRNHRYDLARSYIRGPTSTPPPPHPPDTRFDPPFENRRNSSPTPPHRRMPTPPLPYQRQPPPRLGNFEHGYHWRKEEGGDVVQGRECRKCGNPCKSASREGRVLPRESESDDTSSASDDDTLELKRKTVTYRRSHKKAVNEDKALKYKMVERKCYIFY